MKKHNIIKSVWITTILTLATSVFAAGKPAPVSLTPEGKKLVERYSGMLNELRTELTAKAAKIDQEKAKTPGSAEEKKLRKFLASDKLDAKLARCCGTTGPTTSTTRITAGAHGSERLESRARVY